MSGRHDLTTQLVVAMMSVVVLSMALSVLAFEIVYFTLFTMGLPGIQSVQELYLNPTDIAILAVSIMVGVTLASLLAIRIARQTLRPMRSVEQALRSIAQGDLSARAGEDANAPREAAALVEDFNRMALRLEQASNNISTWNAQIAHELRTPLTVLGGKLQGVVDGVFPPDERLFATLLVQVEALKRLVEDLRVVSLADSGHLALRLEHVQPAQEVQALIDLLQPALEDAGFEIFVTAETGEALIDSGRVRQALLALVENARVHAPPGALHVRTTLSRDRVVFEVADAGTGLPVDFLPDAFRPFERPAMAKGRRGSGLGLSVVRAIALAHGGTASFQRRQGLSTFILDLPRWGTLRDPEPDPPALSDG